MKPKIYTTIIAIFLTAILNKIIAQGNANTTLSNLISPTSINVSMLPKNKSYNLGSMGKPWKLIYIDSAIFLNGVKFITNKAGTAVNNTAIGSNALASAVIGSNNTAVGYYSLYKNTSGSANTAIGFNALYSNTTGSGNIAAGNDVLHFNTTGSDNIAIGDNALYENTKGFSNIAIGGSALVDNTKLNYNIAIGDDALALLNSGNGRCTAVGVLAGDENNSGSYNTFIGASAGEAGSSGDKNTIVGEEAGFYSHGDNDTYLGYHAANSVTSGSSNTIIGYGADVSDGTLSNATALGNYAIAHASNSVRVGNSSVTSIGGYANWSNVSDGRIKKNIKQNVPGLVFINKLQPITYNLDLDAADKIINQPIQKNKEGKIIQPAQFDVDARKAKEQIVYTGFIAQDVEKAAKNLHYDFSGVDAAKNNNDLYGLRYADFVVPLVKAVQELSGKNEELKNQNQEQQNQIENLQSRIAKLESFMNVSSSSSFNQEQIIKPAVANLSQNTPNPFSNLTTINYSIPQQFLSAKIIFTDKNANTLKTIILSNSKGSITVDKATLTSGAYQYTLVVDGKLIDTKQMITAK